MIQEIMSHDFRDFSSQDKIARLMEVLSSPGKVQYAVIEFPGAQYSVVELRKAREVVADLGANVGAALLELPLGSVNDFGRICQSVDIDESDAAGRLKARQSPGRAAVVLCGGRPAGVLKESVRGLFGGMPAGLYGKRFDIFEKGTVDPTHRLTCPMCEATFAFYEPRIEAGRIRYCCPHCRKMIEE